MEVTLSVTRQRHLLFLPWMFSLSNPRAGFMPFLIRACHHQNGHFLARRRFINFLFTSVVAQSARLRAEPLSPEGQKPACGAEASVSSGTCYPAIRRRPRSRLIRCSVFSGPLSSQRSREDVHSFQL